MRVWAGTSGFSYKEWKGDFYPEDLPASEMLAFYASRLPAVEINHTFYRLPRPQVLEGWAEQVGEGFRFVLKASRRITHFKRLKGAEEETAYLLRSAGVLGDRLGAILFQLPPNMRQDVERLRAFLGTLGDPRRAAFEFRHPSWLSDDTFACLEEYGAALCVADTEEEDAELIRTAPWVYVRLRKEDYSDAALAEWGARLNASGAREAYAFFKHEADGAGPGMAERFLGAC